MQRRDSTESGIYHDLAMFASIHGQTPKTSCRDAAGGKPTEIWFFAFGACSSSLELGIRIRYL